MPGHPPQPERSATGEATREATREAAARLRGTVRAVTIGDALLFFLPLIFMTELNMISKSVIHAFLARLPEPKI
ncbi:MAG TPA: hypothetical protein VGC20_15565, partial [bacterium]